MKNILFLYLLCALALIGCSDAYKSKQLEEGKVLSPQQQTFSRTDDETMEEFFRRKYSNLVLYCALAYESALNKSNDTNPKLGGTTEVFTWDILGDYSDEKQLNFNVEFEDFSMSANLDLNLEFVDETNLTVQGEEIRIYRIEEFVALSGKYRSEVTLKGLNGKGSSSAAYIDVNMYDRVPYILESFSTGPSVKPDSRLDLDINCKIEANVKRGFEKQFKVEAQ